MLWCIKKKIAKEKINKKERKKEERPNMTKDVSL
jgi:hypothetical protein